MSVRHENISDSEDWYFVDTESSTRDMRNIFNSNIEWCEMTHVSCRVCHILHAPWFIRIDFNKVPPSQTISYPKQNSINARGEVLQTSVLGLRRIISKEDVRLHDHRMTIKCVASIYESYYKHVEITATLKPRRKHKRRRNEKMVINQEEGSHQEGEITS